MIKNDENYFTSAIKQNYYRYNKSIGKCNDRIIYCTHEYSKCPSKNIRLTNKMTGKVLTDYTNEAKDY